MQHMPETTSWKRISDKVKGLMDPRRAERVKNALPLKTQEKDAAQLASWEGEGGKSEGATLHL